ncbi:uncharacterized protein [Hoplias malabaricus]|uniref:uncharacterized protein n=1 Tax=Hoplias malabaricus TaxID=27720 RepID=UPI0034631489
MSLKKKTEALPTAHASKDGTSKFYTFGKLGESLHKKKPGTPQSNRSVKDWSYNALRDPHLKRFFSRSPNKRQLMKQGLVTADGKVVCSQKEYRQFVRKDERVPFPKKTRSRYGNKVGVVEDYVVDGVRKIVIRMPPVTFDPPPESSSDSEEEDNNSERVVETDEKRLSVPPKKVRFRLPARSELESEGEGSDSDEGGNVSDSEGVVGLEVDVPTWIRDIEVEEGEKSLEENGLDSVLPSPGPSEQISTTAQAETPGTPGESGEGTTSAGKPKKKSRVGTFFRRAWAAIKTTFTCSCCSRKICPD